jgi:peroxiredoxin
MANEKPRVYQGNRPLSASRINRSGLKQGTIAPNFTLPLMDGGQISLDDYRGRRVMIVFSDPKCKPCHALIPDLIKLHRRTPDIDILIISRGNIDAVRAEFQARPVPFPVAVQKSWEISRRYAMFATPIAYVIDEAGKIAGDVAGGPEPILILLASAQIFTLVKTIKEQRDSLLRQIKVARAAARKEASSRRQENARH